MENISKAENENYSSDDIEVISDSSSDTAADESSERLTSTPLQTPETQLQTIPVSARAEFSPLQTKPESVRSAILAPSSTTPDDKISSKPESPIRSLHSEHLKSVQPSLSRGDAPIEDGAKCLLDTSHDEFAHRPESLSLPKPLQYQEPISQDTPTSELNDSIPSQCSSSGIFPLKLLCIL